MAGVGHVRHRHLTLDKAQELAEHILELVAQARAADATAYTS